MTTLQEAARKALKALEVATTPLAKDRQEVLTAMYDLRTALAQHGEQRCTYCDGCGIPAGDVHMSTCKSGKWPSRVSNGDTAAPAQKPVAYITQTEQGPMVWTPEMYGEACTYCDDGEFPVPLFTRPMPAQDVTELVEALERVLNCCDIAECGTVPNSPGALKNARTALSKYKGAK